MFIDELILNGYDRLNTNNFKKIHFTFKKKIQIIIGTNGSGKSSILEELSPLPAESKYYSKDGYKLIKITHFGKRYILKSSFNPVFHSFKIDDEEINTGGTISEQRKLVKQHFNIDLKSHLVSIGKHKFTNMSTDVKKEWFKNLADSNFDYAISVYKRLREASKETTVALKLAKNKLVSISSKVMPKSDLYVLQKECEELYKVVEYMIENRNSPTAPLEKTDDIIQSNLYRIDSISTTVLKTINKLNSYLSDPFISKEVKDIKDASNLVFYISNKLIEIKNKRVTLFDEYKKAQEICSLYEKTVLYKIASISTEIEQLKEKKNLLQKNTIFDFYIEHPEYHIKALEEFSSELLELCLEIPINTDDKFSRENYKKLFEYKQKMVQDIEVLKVNITNFEDNIKHRQEHSETPDVTCPQCQHNFNPFFNPNIIEDLKKKIFTASKEIEHKNKIIEDTDTQLKEFEKWLDIFESIKDIANHFGFMKDFWELIFKKDILYKNPRSISNLITQYKENLCNLQSIEIIDNKIQEELEKLNLAEHTKGIDFQQAQFTLESIGRELDLLANEESRLNNIKDLSSEIVKQTNFIKSSVESIQELQTNTFTLAQTYLEDYLRITFNNILRTFQSELAIKEKTINDEISQVKFLKDLEEEIVLLEKHSEAYELLLKELSPTEGVIAEGLFGFMKIFTKNMNKVIANVWSYPLVIQPCSTEENKLELNYKFPIYVNGSSKPRNDVSEGSRSMKEIINLSFYICAMKAYGLGNCPLFLDEFGSSMDAVHKGKITNLIENISLHENFAQIFIVSHDVAQYSAIDNNEICILNKTNVIIPNNCTYNQHVVFE